MAQLVVYPSQDGYMRAGTDAHFSNARDAGSADIKYTSADTIAVGLSKASASPIYRFYRAYLYFDTSSLPDSGITVTSATLQLYQTGVYSIAYGGIDVFLMDGQPTYPSTTLALSDFDRTFYEVGLGDPINVVSGASGYTPLILSQKGIDAINVTGTTKFCLMSGRDLGYTIPWVGMYTEFYSVEEGGSYRPVLTINYANDPTVTTQAADNETSSSARGNGNITNLGDSSVTAHGMIYSIGADPVNLATAKGTTDEGAAGVTGTFTSTMSGLSVSTTYQCRAYATNSTGTGYGGAVEFTTLAPAAEFTVRTNNASSVADTTATANGTIIEDAGYSITEHGFVYKLGGDPGIPADPTTAEAYTKEGAGVEGAYTSGLTGLTASSTYHIRAYAKSTDGGGQIAYGEPVIFRTGTAASTTLYSSTSDGRILAAGGLGDWDAVHDATTGELDATSDEMGIGVRYITGIGGNAVRIWRGYFYFDTSGIPADATIISAILSLYIKTDSTFNAYAWSLVIQAGTSSTYPHDPLVAGDYLYTQYSGDYGSLAQTSFSAGSYNAIPLSNTSIIQKGGATKMCVRGSMDINDSSGPTDSQHDVTVYTAEKGTVYRPKLVVNYVLPGVIPNYPQINIGDVWKSTDTVAINIGNEWKEVVEMKINIGDTWKDLTT